MIYRYSIKDFHTEKYTKTANETRTSIPLSFSRPIYQIAVHFDCDEDCFDSMNICANYSLLLTNESCHNWKHLDKIAFKDFQKKWISPVYTCTFQKPFLFKDKFSPEDSLLHAEKIDSLKLIIHWKSEKLLSPIHVFISVICDNSLSYDAGLVCLRSLNNF